MQAALLTMLPLTFLERYSSGLGTQRLRQAFKDLREATGIWPYHEGESPGRGGNEEEG